ncbi:unnamed protein product [Cyclocybe aegerita]|uniref:Uncharacterized protein n=1 Tax=Cyclocybe aegerita TaxID=1973307 RepID=A0A8S0WX39_CYCAE|nr:unnamed protein product [Cyclocybe aegerita]
MGRSARMHALPSFTLVLTSDRPLNRHLSVFIEPDPQWSPPSYMSQSTPTPISDYLLKTIDQPLQDGRFAYSQQNDSFTNVDHDDNDDAKTIFEEKGPTTSTGVDSEKGTNKTIVRALASIVVHLRTTGLRLPPKMANSIAPKFLRH